MTLTIVDRSMAAAAATAAATAATADGGSMDDGVDIVGRLQSGSSTGAKPKKIRYARKVRKSSLAAAAFLCSARIHRA